MLPPGSLQAFVIAAPLKGYSAKVDDRTYLSYSMAGRSIFQVDADDGQFVSIILDETSPTARGGVRTLRARSETAAGLLTLAAEDWKAGRIEFKPSDGVGFGL